MAEPQKEGQAGPTSAVIAVLLLFVGAVLVHQLPFLDSRPTSTDKIATRAADRQDVDARLWQDPFTAAELHQQAVWRAGGPSVWPHADPGTAVALKGERVNLLLVPVFGGPYVEEAESRRRLRYATLAGLNVSGFTPDASDRIGYFEFGDDLAQAGDRPGAEGQSGAERGTPRREVRPPAIVPFEWFSRAEKRTEKGNEVDDKYRLLVMWVNEATLRRTPLAKMATLVRASLRDDGSVWAGPRLPPKLHVSILGPMSSDTLSRMIDEAVSVTRTRSADASYGLLRDASIYSYSATTPSSALWEELSPDPRNVERLATLFRSPPLHLVFTRTILSDRLILDSLKDDFERRGILWTDGKTHIALVSEWDSLYGQKVRQAVSNSLCSPKGEPPPAECEGRIHSFSYLRGLDGILPGPEAASKAADKDDRKDQRTPRNISLLERADGGSQFDYLRRLADRIEREMETFPRGEALRVVGVIGTDVYDKLLVLQAMRRRFPHALFFTTDLDARLTHPSEFSWTRNLIVGASFGLQLRQELQRDIPPFRDTYQTSAFFATRAAIYNSHTDENARVTQRNIDQWLQPRIFEIGRERAFDLTPSDATGAWRVDLVCQQDLGRCTAISPLRDAVFIEHLPAHPWKLTVIIAAGTLLIGAASFRVRRSVAAVVHSMWTYPLKAFLGLAATILVCFLVVFTMSYIVLEGDRGEPLTWMSGISIWPTELIRALAAVLAAVFLVKIHVDLGSTIRDLTSRFFPKTSLKGRPDASQPKSRGWWSRVRRIYSGRLVTPIDAPTVDVASIWREVAFQHRPVVRVARLLPVMVLFFLFSYLTIDLLGKPHIPYRGKVSWWVDQILLFGGCTPLMIAVIFSVVDAIKHCDRFTKELTRGVKTAWPSETLADFEQRLGAPDDAVCHWIDVDFIGEWTRRIGPMLYYPFALLALMLIARSSLFADWNTPIGLLIVFGAAFLYAGACAALLWRAAARARRAVVHRLTMILIRAKGLGLHDLADQVTVMIAEVQARERGAFAPVTQQPLVQAVLLPISGAGGLSLLEYFLLRW